MDVRGDRPLENETHRRIIDEMARGLKSGETVEHLMTYHPCGEASSADYLRDKLYIDFHSVQSGHSFGGFDSDKMIKEQCKSPESLALMPNAFTRIFRLILIFRGITAFATVI